MANRDRVTIYLTDLIFSFMKSAHFTGRHCFIFSKKSEQMSVAQIFIREKCNASR